MRFLLILILGGLGIAALAGSPLRAVERPASPPLQAWQHLREQWDPRPEKFINHVAALETCSGSPDRACDEDADNEPRD
jgi:hypothetical protein